VVNLEQESLTPPERDLVDTDRLALVLIEPMASPSRLASRQGTASRALSSSSSPAPSLSQWRPYGELRLKRVTAERRGRGRRIAVAMTTSRLRGWSETRPESGCEFRENSHRGFYMGKFPKLAACLDSREGRQEGKADGLPPRGISGSVAGSSPGGLRYTPSCSIWCSRIPWPHSCCHSAASHA
jgi:hypothetical protein